MTTDALEHDDPTPSSAAGRVGALASVTPVVMLIAWAVISGWIGTWTEFLVTLAAAASIAVIAGWVVGATIGRSIRSGLFAIVAYPTVAWVVMLPIALLLAVLTSLEDTTSDLWTTAMSSVFLLLYALVSTVYVIPLLTPFGAGWALTYYALRRAMRV